MDLDYCKDQLSEAGVRFDRGLSSQELASVERQYSFIFPPDLRSFLTFALPVSTGWIDWTNGSQSEIAEKLNWPYEGICFDIEHNDLWPSSWGEKPATLQEAFERARYEVDKAPRLIPIYGHRYLPDRPHEAGNPVLSVYQTDIIYYGSDLLDYLRNEFLDHFGRDTFVNDGPMRRIEFWSEMADA